MNDGKNEKSTQPYTLVTKKITQRARHNGVFFFIKDLPANNPLIQPYVVTLIQRQNTTTHTLLLHLKRPQVQTLLGYPCTEEHVSIEEGFLNQDHFFAAAHIKLVFGPFTARIYVDQKGREVALKVKVMDAGIEKFLDDDDPMVLSIRKNIYQHSNIETFQTMLKNIFQAKSDKLSTLYKDTMNDESKLVNHLAIAKTHTPKQRKKLFADIQRFIDEIEMINRYDHDEQDRRVNYYREILNSLQLKDPEPAAIQPRLVIESKSEIISPAVIPPDKLLPQSIFLACQGQEQLVTLVDSILETIHMEVQHEPLYVQFLHVYPLLIQLDVAMLAAIVTNKRDISFFVQDQKNRLPFTVFSLDAYFSITLLSGDLLALEFLLPHLSNAQMYVHYWRLLQFVQENPENISVANCNTMRFLYEKDERFQDIARINSQQFQYIKAPQNPIVISVLMRLFIINNLEGFRTLLSFEKERVMAQIHLIINEKQFNLLNSCLVLYHDNPNPAFIQVLFEHGMTVDHPVECFPMDMLAQIDKQMNKKTIGSFKNSVVNALVGRGKISSNSLIFAMQKSLLKDAELIQVLIQYSDLESVARALACFFSQEQFCFRLFVSHTPVIGATQNIKACDKLMVNLMAQPGFSKSIACVAYLTEASSEEDAEQYLRLSRRLGERLSALSDQLNSDEKRLILNKLIQSAKTAQREGDRKLAFSIINAGLFVWTFIEDRTQADYEAILQLLFLRGMVSTQIYSKNQDRLAYSSYIVGLDLINDPENAMGDALKETSIYKLLFRSCQQCIARINNLHDTRMFGDGSTLVMSDTDKSKSPASPGFTR